MDHDGKWWPALKANGVPRKLWLLRAGHTDPFESRRAVWVDTLHRWFDHWLYGVNNGIETEPAVTIEDEKDIWVDYTDWPIPGTQNVDVYLRGPPTPPRPARSAAPPAGARRTRALHRPTNTNETTLMNTPTGSQANRRVFLSRPLTKDVRLSGTATVDLVAALGATQ